MKILLTCIIAMFFCLFSSNSSAQVEHTNNIYYFVQPNSGTQLQQIVQGHKTYFVEVSSCTSDFTQDVHDRIEENFVKILLDMGLPVSKEKNKTAYVLDIVNVELEKKSCSLIATVTRTGEESPVLCTLKLNAKSIRSIKPFDCIDKLFVEFDKNKDDAMSCLAPNSTESYLEIIEKITKKNKECKKGNKKAKRTGKM